MNFEAKKSWKGPTGFCQFCGISIEFTPWFVDGVTNRGPWGMMCNKCFMLYGKGLGKGIGQKYATKTKLKIEG
jgi:hypothetical protein